jgi:glycine cleavage system regulatory protein
MGDSNHLILTAVGPDRVGLVERISEFIARHGCNIEDSKMAVFCGEFALIVLLAGDGSKLVKVASNYRQIEAETGLTISIKTPAIRQTPQSFLPYKLTASCMDHPGIVYQISNVLSSMGVNIESMETKTYSAPISGTPIFELEADLAVPILGDQPVHAVFIRAPIIDRIGPGVDVLARLDDGRIVAVRQRNVVATAFHPELSGEPRFHRLIATMAAEHSDPGEGAGRRPHPTRRAGLAG